MLAITAVIFIPLVLLTFASAFLLPLITALVAGDIVASEDQNGPLKTILTRSLLRGLSLLTCFGPDGAARGIVELARDAGMSPSTAHRYASTLVELGLLERCPKSRKYRLPDV